MTLDGAKQAWATHQREVLPVVTWSLPKGWLTPCSLLAPQDPANERPHQAADGAREEDSGWPDQ